MYYNHPKKFSNTDSRCVEFATHNNSSKQVSSCLKIDFHIIDLPSALAGRLAHFRPNWQLISSNPDVLAAVSCVLARDDVTVSTEIFGSVNRS